MYYICIKLVLNYVNDLYVTLIYNIHVILIYEYIYKY